MAPVRHRQEIGKQVPDSQIRGIYVSRLLCCRRFVANRSILSNVAPSGFVGLVDAETIPAPVIHFFARAIPQFLSTKEQVVCINNAVYIRCTRRQKHLLLVDEWIMICVKKRLSNKNGPFMGFASYDRVICICQGLHRV